MSRQTLGLTFEARAQRPFGTNAPKRENLQCAVAQRPCATPCRPQENGHQDNVSFHAREYTKI